MIHYKRNHSRRNHSRVNHSRKNHPRENHGRRNHAKKKNIAKIPITEGIFPKQSLSKSIHILKIFQTQVESIVSRRYTLNTKENTSFENHTKENHRKKNRVEVLTLLCSVLASCCIMKLAWHFFSIADIPHYRNPLIMTYVSLFWHFVAVASVITKCS